MATNSISFFLENKETAFTSIKDVSGVNFQIGQTVWIEDKSSGLFSVLAKPEKKYLIINISHSVTTNVSNDPRIDLDYINTYIFVRELPNEEETQLVEESDLCRKKDCSELVHEFGLCFKHHCISEENTQC